MKRVIKMTSWMGERKVTVTAIVEDPAHQKYGFTKPEMMDAIKADYVNMIHDGFRSVGHRADQIKIIK